MRFLIRMGPPPLILMFWGSTRLKQRGSPAPLLKFLPSSQFQESDRLFLKDFGHSWTSLEEWPLHCCTEARAKTVNMVYESGTGVWILWRNLYSEFWFWPIVATLLFCFGLVWFSYILMRCLSSVIHNESRNRSHSLRQRTWSFALSSNCYLSLGSCFTILGRQGPLFMGQEIIITNTEKDKRL